MFLSPFMIQTDSRVKPGYYVLGGLKPMLNRSIAEAVSSVDEGSVKRVYVQPTVRELGDLVGATHGNPNGDPDGTPEPGLSGTAA